MEPTLSTSISSSLLIYFFFSCNLAGKGDKFVFCFLTLLFFLFFGFHVFPLSFPSGSNSPFWEFIVTLPPPLWRGAQLLTLVPPALLPVRAGLELWKDGEQLAPECPASGLSLLWTFLGMAGAVPTGLGFWSKKYVKT